MAKGILWFFGIADLIAGAVFILMVFNAKSDASALTGIYAGTAAILAGALMLGFARVITLLEQIAENTGPSAVAAAPDAPRPGNHSLAGAVRQDAYADRPYTVHGDGMVVSRIDGSPATWRNEAEFKAWADREAQPAS